jgi:hypothetical protein
VRELEGELRFQATFL